MAHSVLELHKRLRRSVSASISHRITLYAVGLTTAVVLAIAAISYGAMYVLLRAHANDELQARAELKAQKLQHDLYTLAHDVAGLAENSLLVNSLLESQSRDIYVLPFLRDYKSPIPVAVTIALCDFLGRPIASNGPRTTQSYARFAAVKAALDTGRAQADVLREGGPVLLLAQPMFYPATRQVEGVLIGTVDLADVLIVGADVLDWKYHTRLLAGRSLLAGTGDRALAENVIQASKPLALGAPLDALKLEVSVGVRRDEAVSTLSRVTGAYLAIGAITLLVVFVLARYMATRLIRPLSALNRTARQISETGATDIRAPVTGSDEIGSLAKVFNQMLDRLRAFQELLEQRVAERTAALRQAEQRLASVLESMNDVVWSVSPQTFEVLYVNPAVERIYGRGVDEFTRNSNLWIEAIHAADRNRVAQTFYPDLLRNGTASAIYRVMRPDGQVRWVEDRGHVVRDTAGKVERLDGIVTDITERRQAEEALRLRDRAIESTVNAILITANDKPDNPIEYVNPAFERITGYSAAQALGRNGRFLQGEDRDQPELERIRAAMREEREGRALLRNYRKDGSLFWNELHVAPVRNEAGDVTHFVGVLNDVTEAKRYQTELEHQATHDALTGLANRNLLNDRLTQALIAAQRHGRNLAVAFIDLDRFRLVNDSLGHSGGDALLKTVAERLKSLVRGSDTVARLGGDEFVLLWSDQKSDDSPMQIAQRVLEKLAQPHVIDGREAYVTCSIGVSIYPPDGGDAETLLRSADAALYRAKETGGNNVFFYAEGVNARFRERLALDGSLHRAIEQQQFVLHYQPKLDLSTRRVVGLEALLRWQHPDRGLVSPAEFIPVLEETGMIVEVGRQVFEMAAADYARLLSKGLSPPRIAVNVSQRQLQRSDFVSGLRQAASDWQNVAAWLDLEITESMLMADVEENAAKLTMIREMGAEIAIDDFGTGYSSLSYLARLPVGALKIDRSFISRATSDPDSMTIVSTIISLAHSLKMKVIAEGVETEEQAHLLKLLRCDEIQGYLVARPAPLADIEGMIGLRL